MVGAGPLVACVVVGRRHPGRDTDLRRTPIVVQDEEAEDRSPA
ncbi:hypothetical protein GALL_263210 [mine drainage metagenome]|uniref:Uncharacterized protein n=1 Tax=mine drainage metagenome TaxID=410659 RepID=A0A1J5R725_9ZZZZ